MLRKILLVLVLVGMIAIVGCKKEEPAAPEVPQPTQEQQSALDGLKEQAGTAADQAKDEAGKQLEDAGKALQK
ncbi:MAG: hypothetical protein A2Y12_07605 [Planctomycetes bacterium GWF2_42_9]|nr:MAG: hypothetical protein A2Y12_07605 [Planctomycetes bacterium GWF2_42_9]HAL45712.1 hypothetical protein [Phycisphaerales bacterium]